MYKKCFPLIIVFYIEHISVQLVLMNVYSYDGLCLSFENCALCSLQSLFNNAIRTKHLL